MDLADVGTPERRGADHWFVPNARVPTSGYHVERIDGRWVCRCPAHRWRRERLCRHVQAVLRRLRKEVPMGDGNTGG
jgi:hypothetical protein